jgi:hypothetical protein
MVYIYPAVFALVNEVNVSPRLHVVAELLAVICIILNVALSPIVHYLNDFRLNAAANLYLGFKNMEDLLKTKTVSKKGHPSDRVLEELAEYQEKVQIQIYIGTPLR